MPLTLCSVQASFFGRARHEAVADSISISCFDIQVEAIDRVISLRGDLPIKAGEETVLIACMAKIMIAWPQGEPWIP